MICMIAFIVVVVPSTMKPDHKSRFPPFKLLATNDDDDDDNDNANYDDKRK